MAPNPQHRLPDGEVLEIPAAVMAEMDRLDSLVDTIVIRSDADVEELNALGKRALELHKALDADRLNSKRPYAKQCDDIDAWARPFLLRFKTTQDRAKAKLTAYAIDIRRRREELEAAQRRAEVAASTVTPPAGRIIAPLLPKDDLPADPKIPMRVEYDVRYIDIDKIPREFMTPDHEKILMSLKQNPNSVTGCELVTLQKVVTR